jgi:hypothetical protein
MSDERSHECATGGDCIRIPLERWDVEVDERLVGVHSPMDVGGRKTAPSSARAGLYPAEIVRRVRRDLRIDDCSAGVKSVPRDQKTQDIRASDRVFTRRDARRAATKLRG